MDIKNFVNQWREVTSERANYQKFWLTLIREVFNIDKPENFIQFEVPVQLAHKSFIDGYFPDSKVIIEQKAVQENLPTFRRDSLKLVNLRTVIIF